MADIRKEALTAADKFEIRCNARRIKKAALEAVAAHEAPRVRRPLVAELTTMKNGNRAIISGRTVTRVSHDTWSVQGGGGGEAQVFNDPEQGADFLQQVAKYSHEKTSTLLSTTTGDPDEDKILQALRQRPMTTGEIEKTLFAGGKYSHNAWAAISSLKQKGFIKQKQMRWYAISPAAHETPDESHEASGDELEKEYLEQIAASAKPPAHGFDPKMVWQYGGWLLPNSNVVPDMADPDKAYNDGAIYFDTNGDMMVVKFKDMDHHTEQRIQQFVEKFPPPEDLKIQFKSLDGGVSSLAELFEKTADLAECPYCPHAAHAGACDERANGCVCQGLDENWPSDLPQPEIITASKTAAPEDESKPYPENSTPEGYVEDEDGDLDLIREKPEEVERTMPATEAAPAEEVGAPEAEAPPSEHDESSVRVEVEATIDDPETVTAVMELLKEQNLMHADGMKVEEGVWGWSEALNFATVSFAEGHTEYMVAPTGEAAENLALAMVRQELQDEPEMFTQSMLESYIDKDKLRSELHSDVESMVRESPDSYGWTPDTVRDEDEGDKQMSFPAEDEPSDEWVEDTVTRLLHDPMSYLEEIYGDETAKRAIDIAGINIDEAASDFLAADGAGKWLSSYDGNVHDLPSGGVWWKH
jgi:hypothetical protein